VELAKSCDYAIQGLLYLAKRDDPFEPVLLRDIAARAHAPEAFLSKLFQTLRASNLVRSHRGKKRGYSLARPPRDISLYDIIVATDGPATLRSIPNRALPNGTEEAFRQAWSKIEDQMVEALKHTTLHTILVQGAEGRA
jgi:Rrf2 family protein